MGISGYFARVREFCSDIRDDARDYIFGETTGMIEYESDASSERRKRRGLSLQNKLIFSVMDFFWKVKRHDRV